MPARGSDEGEPVGSGEDRHPAAFAAAHARGGLGHQLPPSLAGGELGRGHGRGGQARFPEADEVDAPL
eukprot:5698826-Alexandrium_andersonii.AAC.1